MPLAPIHSRLVKHPRSRRRTQPSRSSLTESTLDSQLSHGPPGARAHHFFAPTYQQVLSGSLPRGLAHLGSIVIGFLHKRKLRYHRYAAQDHRLRRITEFSEESHGPLWDQMSGNAENCVVRDPSYMNWKYIDQPQAPIAVGNRGGGAIFVGSLLLEPPPQIASINILVDTLSIWFSTRVIMFCFKRCWQHPLRS